jgi:Putative transposase/Transposase zinc-binding domain
MSSTASCLPHTPAAAPVLTVADIIRSCGDSFLQKYGTTLTATQRQALAAVAACRTPALGGHLWQCGACGHGCVLYNSCRNRHCPTCQAATRAVWLERETAWLLPVAYHHVVFTLPAEVAALALRQPALLYGLLFRAASATLREVAATAKYLGAEVGVVAVLHTWGQNLHHHPHLHCLVTGGGLACDATGRVDERPRWRSCRPGFFLPVRVLSRVFRGKFLEGLRQAHARSELRVEPEEVAAGSCAAWQRALYQQDWVVYSQPPAAGPEVVLKYLARYVHRVALSNSRLRSLAEGQVSFVWKDYAHGGREKVLTLSGEEFLRRWLQHVLPKGFVKVRHYGLLASRGREEKLAVCRGLLLPVGVPMVLPEQGAEPQAEPVQPVHCPECGSVQWHKGAELPRLRVAPAVVDSS